MKFKEYIYKKVIIEEETGRYFLWYLIHKESREGVHFHGRQYRPEQNEIYSLCDGNQYGFTTFGVEAHYKNPIYEGQKPIEDCEVTGGECFCDGTSLNAKRHLSHINPEKDDDQIWDTLHWFFKIWMGDNDGG